MQPATRTQHQISYSKLSVREFATIISSVPAILVAFTAGTTLALEVIVLYLSIHSIEAYVLVPIIQRHAVALPPALSIVSVVIFGWLFGPLGVVFAHPLMVTMMVLVNELRTQADDAAQ